MWHCRQCGSIFPGFSFEKAARLSMMFVLMSWLAFVLHAGLSEGCSGWNITTLIFAPTLFVPITLWFTPRRCRQCASTQIETITSN